MPGPWRCVIAALPTPFAEDGAADPARFAALGRAVLDAGCDALAAFTEVGDAGALTSAEHAALLDALAGAVPPRAILAGAAGLELADVDALTRRAGELGVGGVYLAPPPDAHPETVRAYRDAGVASGRPLVVGAHAETFAWDHPAAVVAADGGGDAVRAVADRAPGVPVVARGLAAVAPVLEAGASGVLASAACVYPRAAARAWRLALSREGQPWLDALRARVRVVDGPAAVKAVLADQLGDPQWAAVRPPGEAVGAEALRAKLAPLAALAPFPEGGA